MKLVDRKIALLRMAKAGAIMTSCESLIFEIIKGSKSPYFKKILEIIKEKNKIQCPIEDIF